MSRLGRYPIAMAILAGTSAIGAAQQSDLSGTLVVLNKGANTASVIDLATGRTVATLPPGNGPHELAMSSDGRTAVATDYGASAPGNSLTVIDVARARVLRTIDLGQYSRPHGAAFLPGDSILAVTSETTRTVVMVRIRDGVIVQTVSTDGQGSHMLAVEGDGRTIWTGNIQSNTVSRLDLERGRAEHTVNVPPQPEAITVTPDGGEVWVASNAEGSVSVIDTRSDRVDRALSEFGWPYRILITPDQQLVIIPDLRKHQIRFVDRASRQQLEVMEIPGAGPQGIALSSDARLLFVSLSEQDQVAVIDLATREIVRRVSTGSGPDGIGYSPLVVRRPD